MRMLMVFFGMVFACYSVAAQAGDRKVNARVAQGWESLVGYEETVSHTWLNVAFNSREDGPFRAWTSPQLVFNGKGTSFNLGTYHSDEEVMTADGSRTTLTVRPLWTIGWAMADEQTHQYSATGRPLAITGKKTTQNFYADIGLELNLNYEQPLSEFGKLSLSGVIAYDSVWSHGGSWVDFEAKNLRAGFNLTYAY